MRATQGALALLSALILSPFAVVVAQTAGLPDTPGGRCAAAYLEGYNAADEAALASFFTSCMAEDFARRRPISDAVATTLGFRRETGRLVLDRVSGSTDSSLALLLRTERGGWIELSFRIDPRESGRLAGILLDEAEPPGAGEAAPASLDAFPGAVAALVKSRSDAGGFSGVVLVAVGDRVVAHESAGLANRAFAVPVAKDTKFNLGSINKLFTRIAVAQLAEKGRLSLDDTVGKLLPDYPNPDVAEKVTVRQLLDFTSGMGDFFGDKFDATPKDRLRDHRDYLALFASDPLLFEPGTSRRYSNAGYVVLGLIVERISGRRYGDYVREHVFGPAGMGDTDSYEADVPVVNLAEGYTLTWGGADHPGLSPRSNVYSRPARGSAAGGGYSTAPDLLKFARALRAGRLLGPAHTRWVLGGPEPGKAPEGSSPNSASPGLGVAGGAPGINAFLAIEGESVVVSLSNLDPPSAVNVGRKVAGWVRDLTQGRETPAP